MSKTSEQILDDLAMYLIGAGWSAFDNKNPLTYESILKEKIKEYTDKHFIHKDKVRAAVGEDIREEGSESVNELRQHIREELNL